MNIDLRDYMAAQVDPPDFKTGDAKSYEELVGKPMPSTDQVEEFLKWQYLVIAKSRYMMADAMLEMRGD